MKKRVKIVCWWTSSENITKRTIDQFNIKDATENIEFVYDNSYDWLVVCGKLPNEHNLILNKSHTIFFGMEPSWSPNTDKDAANYSSYICTHNKNIFNHKDATFFEEPNFMFYGGRGDDGWTISNLNSLDFTKNKDMSVIVTKRGNCWGTQNIYDQRVQLAEKLSEYSNIDIFGTFWDNNGTNTHGEIWNKLIPLQSYKFSVGIENTIEKDYITEKFYDCILTETIPIYCGAPNIADYFDINGMIYLNNIYDINESMNQINSVISNIDSEYNQRLHSCLFNKNQFLNNHNLLFKINSIIFND
jgi:hypothetical protein